MTRLIVALVLIATAFTAAPAQAASVDVSCTGAETVTYTPGLTMSPRLVSVEVNGVMGPCASTDPGITAGTYAQKFTASLSCASLLEGLAATRAFHWNNGDSSAFTYNRALNNAAGQTTVTFAGTITGGEFSGATAVQQAVFVTPGAGDCLGHGLISLGPGPTVLTVNTL